MRSGKKTLLPGIIFCFVLSIISCRNEDVNSEPAGRLPSIEPDYAGITIPPNIAPMNFKIMETGELFIVEASTEKGGKLKLRTADGKMKFPLKAWKKLIESAKGEKIRFQISISDGENSRMYEPFFMFVAPEPIDPYLTYRLIHPGYYSWSGIKIMQRCIENFNEEPVIDNEILDKNCINCHSFNNNDPGKFLVHIRGSKSGTYIIEDNKITRTDPRTDNMPGSATYPSWHPDGNYVAFSSNQVRQSFYAAKEKSIEVFDLVSGLVLYDRKKNEILTINEDDTLKYQRTFPSWSPDGKYLYYCKAVNKITGANPSMEEILNTHYDLVRKPFSRDSANFGKSKVIFNASEMNKSVSFPRISPDGLNLIFTLHDFGTFPIWHREADLYMLNTGTLEYKKLDLNSNESESYHSWSSNGKWLVFSSKRTDGRSTRPFMAYIESWEHTGKPFILPQKDPDLYDLMLESFNIPELITGRIRMKPKDFAKAAYQVPVKSNSSENHKFENPAINPDSIKYYHQ